MLFEGDIDFINEEFYVGHVTPLQLDMLLASGWRHFGPQFFRYSLGIYESDIRRVIPLRIRLDSFSFSKSQRRVLRQNQDAVVELRSIEAMDNEATALFERHKTRFKAGVPDSIADFISSPMPCDALELNVRIDDRLIAASYFDIGERTVSAIYGMFDPEFSYRSLGIFTMLKEIEYAIEQGKELYYQGYAYDGPSFYDYKKRFRPTERYDWNGNWSPLAVVEELNADDTDQADEEQI